MPMWIRRLFWCRLHMCGGIVSHDNESVFWRCVHCGKITRGNLWRDT